MEVTMMMMVVIVTFHSLLAEKKAKDEKNFEKIHFSMWKREREKIVEA
jgi:hypothetical protein